jgi:hypothetical protein
MTPRSKASSIDVDQSRSPAVLQLLGKADVC